MDFQKCIALLEKYQSEKKDCCVKQDIQKVKDNIDVDFVVDKNEKLAVKQYLALQDERNCIMKEFEGDFQSHQCKESFEAFTEVLKTQVEMINLKIRKVIQCHDTLAKPLQHIQQLEKEHLYILCGLLLEKMQNSLHANSDVYEKTIKSLSLKRITIVDTIVQAMEELKYEI